LSFYIYRYIYIIYNFLTLIKSHISNYIAFFEAQQKIDGGKEGPRERQQRLSAMKTTCLFIRACV